jgi:hypothetical protein
MFIYIVAWARLACECLPQASCACVLNTCACALRARAAQADAAVMWLNELSVKIHEITKHYNTSVQCVGCWNRPETLAIKEKAEEAGT